MCNINIILDKSKRRSHRVTECLNVVTHLSYQSNDDGDGYFTENFKVRKSAEKQIIRGNHWLGVTHQRLSTSGKHEEMTQPIESDNFILVHNGIFRGDCSGDEEESDSYKFLNKLEDSYSETNSLLTTLKLVLKEQAGYWSCVIYDKNTGSLYYFKSKTSVMYMIDNEDFLLMSTKKTNVEYMRKYFKQTDDILEPEPFHIFDMLNNFETLDIHKEYKEPAINNNFKWWEKRNNRSGIEKICGSNWASTGLYKLRELLSDYFITPFSVARHKDKDGEPYYSIGINTERSRTQLESCFGSYVWAARYNRGVTYYFMYEDDLIEVYETELEEQDEMSKYFIGGVM